MCDVVKLLLKKWGMYLLLWWKFEYMRVKWFFDYKWKVNDIMFKCIGEGEDLFFNFYLCKSGVFL